MKEFKFKSKAISAKTILEAKIGNFPMLLENIFPMYGVVALGGSSDLGKSYLLQQLAGAIATNEESFLGFKLKVNIPSAVYVATEDDFFTMNTRLKNFEKQYEGKFLESLRFLFDYRNLAEEISAELTHNPASVVIIDTFSDVFDKAINDSIAVRGFLGQFKLIAHKHECLIIFNHHCGKNNDNRPPSKDNLLGSQGFESSMGTVLELRQDLNNPDYRHLCVVKSNHVGKEFKCNSFELDYNFETGFKNTGNRVPFNELSSAKKGYNHEAIRGRISEMRNAGITIRDIADRLKEDGIPIGKTTVGDIAKETCPPPKPI